MPDMTDAATKPRMKLTRGIAVSVVLHLVLAVVFLLKLPLPQTDAAKEDAVSVELVEPPKPPEPEKKQEPEKKARMPAPKQQSTPPAPPPPTSAGAPPPPQEQAFETGSQDEQMDEPEGAAPSAAADGNASTAPKPAEQEAVAKPVPKPALTPAAIDMLRAKMQAAEAEQAKEEAKAEPPKPAEKPPEEKKPEEKPAQEMAKAEGKPDKPKGKDEAAKVALEQMTEAKKHYSKKMLSDPRVKQALGQLPPERRIVQICSIEALEQVRHARPDAFPDLLVPFSTGGGLISDHVLDAKGGAFRAREGWFDIAYRCQVDAETTRIVSFRYEIGGPVPRGDWARRKLPAE